MRILADLDQRQIDALKSIGERHKMSRAALLREAVDDLINKRRLELMEEAFGLWKGKVPYADGLEMQEALRSEWEGR